MPELDLQQLELDIFHGQLHPGSAEIYAQLSGRWDAAEAWQQGWRLVGEIDGPYADSAATLPARLALQDHGRGETLLAHVTLPDPCFWSPEVPLRYQVRVDLVHQGTPVWSSEQTVGLRQLGLEAGRIQLAHEPWTVIGGQPVPGVAGQLPTGMVAVVQASTLDVATSESIADGWMITLAPAGVIQSELLTLLRSCNSPANWCVVLQDGALDVPRSVAPNLLRGQLFSADEPLLLADWAEIAFVQFSTADDFASRTADCPLPVVAVGEQPAHAGWDEIRQSCQGLLQQLSAYRQFAGYIVVRGETAGEMM